MHLIVMNQKFSRFDLIREIIYKGADLNSMQDDNGKSVYDLVMEISDEDIRD